MGETHYALSPEWVTSDVSNWCGTCQQACWADNMCDCCLFGMEDDCGQ